MSRTIFSNHNNRFMVPQGPIIYLVKISLTKPIVLFQTLDVDDFIVDDEGNPINRHTKKKRRIPGTLQDS